MRIGNTEVRVLGGGLGCLTMIIVSVVLSVLLTVPTTKGGGHEFSNGGMRLDYVMARPEIAAYAGDARVIRGDEAEWASDHYPLAVGLALTAPR